MCAREFRRIITSVSIFSVHLTTGKILRCSVDKKVGIERICCKANKPTFTNNLRLLALRIFFLKIHPSKTEDKGFSPAASLSNQVKT